MGLLFPKPDSKQERADARSGKIARRKALYAEAYSLANGHCLFCLARGNKKTLAGQFHHINYGAGGRVEESANDIMPCC